MLLDDTGTAKAAYGYSAYGDKEKDLTKESEADFTDGASDDSDPLNTFRYSDRRLDSGSGTLDMGARRFGPDTSHFLQEDVLDGALNNLGLAEDPLTQNRYALAGGNPISFVEIDGHMLAMDGGGGGSSSSSTSETTSRTTSVPISDAASSNGYRDMPSSTPQPTQATRRPVARPSGRPRADVNPTDPFGNPFNQPSPLEQLSGRCRGSEAIDCTSEGFVAGAKRAREGIIERNRHRRASGNPATEARSYKSSPPWAKRLRSAGRFAGPAGLAASAGVGLVEGEGVGRVSVKTAASGYLAAQGAAAGLACGPGAIICSPALAVGGAIVGNVGGDVVADVADPVFEEVGDLVGGGVGEGIGDLFND
jgi:RHS repeat-associated protein